MNKTKEEIIKECFGSYRPTPKRLGSQVIKIVEERRAIRRAEIEENIEKSKLRKIYGKNVKFVENDSQTRLEKVKERLRLKLLEKDRLKITD